MATSSKTSANRWKFWVILLSGLATFGVLIFKIREYYLSQKLKGKVTPIPKQGQTPEQDPKKKVMQSESSNESLIVASLAN